MEHAALSPLASWESFYVIIGSSAAALTGLQFVVIVLGAEASRPASVSITRAFGTPTVVHFCAVLLISAMLSAPWPALSSAAIGLAVFAVAGIVYAVNVVRHARRQTDYVPVFEDWFWHCALPLLAYAALLVASIVLLRHPAPSLFVIAGTAMLLLFVGIHNAWDAVVYIASQRRQGTESDEKS